MERALASKDEEIGQLQAQNKELVTKQKDLEAKMEQIVQESVQGRVSSVEQAAPPQLPNIEIETLQEELQTKNQQVNQYQRQVTLVRPNWTGSLDILKVEPSLENGTGDEVFYSRDTLMQLLLIKCLQKAVDIQGVPRSRGI